MRRLRERAQSTLRAHGEESGRQGKFEQEQHQHGMRAKNVLILPGETQEEYDKVVSGWNDYWRPADYQEEKLVETSIRNDCMHKRAQRWHLEAEAGGRREDGLGPMDWTAAAAPDGADAAVQHDGQKRNGFDTGGEAVAILHQRFRPNLIGPFAVTMSSASPQAAEADEKIEKLVSLNPCDGSSKRS